MNTEKITIHFLSTVETKQNQFYIIGKKKSPKSSQVVPVIAYLNLSQDSVWIKKIENVRWNKDTFMVASDESIFIATTVNNLNGDCIPKLVKLDSSGNLIISKSALNIEFSCRVEELILRENSIYVLLSSKNYFEVDFDLNCLELTAREAFFTFKKSKYAHLDTALKYDYTTLTPMDQDLVNFDFRSMIDKSPQHDGNPWGEEHGENLENKLNELYKLKQANEMDYYLLKELL